MRNPTLTIEGRILYITEDLELLKKQLEGEDIDWNESIALRDNISTDEITPGWVCFYYDETLGRYSLVGLKGGAVEKDSIQKGGFGVIVSGLSKGCGSSRETAPYSEMVAGARLILAKSIEKIYAQNCQNIGLLTSTDFGLLDRIKAGEKISIEEFTKGLDPISADVVRSGGLFAYNKRRLAGKSAPPSINTAERPMTLVEKIISRSAIADAKSGKLGVPAVKPGDALFIRTAVRFSHEYVTPMADSLFRAALGEDAEVRNPESVYTFRDHLTFLGDVMSEEKRDMGLMENAQGLAETQSTFSKRHNLKLYGESARGGSEAICHNAVMEDLALPGDVVVGTDSHTCMAGVLGAFAFGVGSTDMANSWFTEDVRVRVPETVYFHLVGKMNDDVSAKDVMLHILSQPFFRTSKGIGKVLEFGGPGVESMKLDERATLTNMAVEAGGFTGIVKADEKVLEYLRAQRGIQPDTLKDRLLESDPDAVYLEKLEIDLSQVVPMVATPGDPRNGVALQSLTQRIKIDIAYGGSCTGGKKADMDMYADVFREAAKEGRKVADGVECFIQFGSQQIRSYAEDQGYVALFQESGVTMINPSCGACINAGPGASKDENTITISAQNRNFPGRSGPGDVYLASPYAVAASAINGYISSSLNEL